MTADSRSTEGLSRRRLLVAGSAGVAVLGLGVQRGEAATESDLAFANFGLATSYLLADFYARALESGRLGAAARPSLRTGRAASSGHARALTELLTGAGDTPASVEDFSFEWPASAFATQAAVRRTGTGVLTAALGAHQRAAASVSEPTYRVLFASIVASLGQQVGALGGAVEPFPAALELEAASAALESFLG